MEKNIKYAAKFYWSEIASITGELIASQLGRKVSCTAGYDAQNYWSVSAAKDETFTVDELKTLLDFINADLSTRHECLPPDSDSSRAICMSVSETLLSVALETAWEHSSICREGLWLVGIEDISAISKLISKRGGNND